MRDEGGILRRLRFRPNPGTDGAFERAEGAPVPVPPPDWDRALDLLRRINALADDAGRRISSILTEDGFEPWWYGQDRLLRFYLVPLTQLLPLLEAVEGEAPVAVADAPPDLARVLQAVGGRSGFPAYRAGAAPAAGSLRGKAALLALSLFSLAAFRAASRDTLFFIIDHVNPGLREDFRFVPLYRELERAGYRFAEYAHTLSPHQALRNFFPRRRPVFFLEAADFWGRIAGERAAIPTAEFSGRSSDRLEDRALRALIPVALDSCAQSVVRQRMLKRALRFQRVRRALIFDDNRHNHELVAACLSLGIPVLGFQHGVFNKFHAGLMAYGFGGARPHAFDRYGVWSGLFRDRLLTDTALYRPEQVFVAGPLRPPEGIPSDRSRAGQKTAAEGKVRVLVVSEPLARKSEVAVFLQVLQSDPRFELFLKLRPGESRIGLRDYALSASTVRLLESGSVYEAFRQVDVAVGTYSSVLYEALLADVPAVWMKTTRAYGRELADDGLAEAAARPEELPDAVLRAAALPEDERRRRRERAWGEAGRSGAASLVQTLKQLGGPPG
ncbi:MAG: hypothetical protein JW929_10405 [Anaerolineales bacterium]|nr:hypothetical protein [Anaerolineales bacterium]